MKEHTNNQTIQIGRGAALGLVLSIIAIISVSLFIFKAEPHIPIFASIVVLIGYSVIKRHSWTFIESGIRNGLKEGLIPIFYFS